MADSPHLQRASTIATPAGQAARPRRIATARRLAAEVIGTFWLVLGGCGAAVLAGGTGVPGTIGIAGVALAFGLTVFTMAFAVGFISGGHFNPAVSVGLTVAGRFPARDQPGYVIAQVIGGILGSAALAALHRAPRGSTWSRAGSPRMAMACILRADTAWQPRSSPKHY